MKPGRLIAAIREFRDRRGYAPTVDDLAEITGRAHSTIYDNLKRLRELGVVDWLDGQQRTLHIIDDLKETT